MSKSTLRCSSWIFDCKQVNLEIVLRMCPEKTHLQNAAGATVHWLHHHLPAPLVSGDWFFGRFLLRLSRIKRPQVMSMVKFSPIALNFGYDFVLLVHFFGTRCTNSIFYFSIKRRLVVVIHSFIVSSLWLMYKGIYAYKVQLWQRNCHNHDFKALIILNWLRCLTKLYLPMLCTRQRLWIICQIIK